MLSTMQGNHSDEVWRQGVEKILANDPQGRQNQASSRDQNTNDMSSSSCVPENSRARLSMLLQQRQGQIDPQALLRLQPQGNTDNLLGLSGQNPGGLGGAGAFGAPGNESNDRLLLQLLNEQRQRQQQQQHQQPSFDPIQQALLQRELERESLLQQINAMNGAGLLGLHSYGGLGADALRLSQGAAVGLDQSRLSALFGSQLPPQLGGHSPMLQGGLGGFGPGGALGGAPGLGSGPGGLPSVGGGGGLDDSITLEARSKQAFPLKLYRMLERAERNRQEDIISFIDDGKAFAIHKPRAFETDIMPSYFNSHRMSSFQRQLNIYGFERINDGVQKGAYRHKFFIKGKKELLGKIKRPHKLRHGGTAAPEEDEEAAKLQTMAAEHLVGLSRTSGAESSTKSDKSETESTGEKAEKEE